MRAPRDASLSWSLAVSAVALLIYVLTLHPDVAGGDSGELTGAIVTGGVIHPPGYPLYALLGRLFLLVPHGTLAWRVNLLSAVGDAAAAGVVCAAVTRLGGPAPETADRLGGVVAGALLAAAPGIWRYAICAEVFALDNLAVALLLLLAVLHAEARDARWLPAGALVCGLSLSNHQTSLFTIVPLAAWALFTRSSWRTLRAPRQAGAVVLALLLGLAPYLSLPLAAAHHAAITWGAADTWTGFWDHVLRREYGTFQLAPAGIAAAPDRWLTFEAWAASAREDLGLGGAALAAVGVVAGLRGARRGLVVASLVSVGLAVGVLVLLGNLPVTDALHRGIVARFWQQPLVHLCVWAGAGFAWLSGRLASRLVWSGALGARGARLANGLTWAVAAGIAVMAPALRFRSMDRHGNTLVRRYGDELLRAAPPGALLVTKGDLITSSIRYLQAAEHVRPDVRVIDQELLGLPWYVALVRAQHPEIVLPGPRFMPGASDAFTMRQLVDENFDRAPVLVCGGIKPPDTSTDGVYGRWPFGLCEWVHRGTEPVSLDAWVRDSDAALPRIDFTGQARPEGSWEAIVWSDTWEVRDARAAHLMLVAGADPARRPYVAMAADMLQRLVDEQPDEPPHVFRNLAMALGRAGLDTDARRAQAAEAWRRYLANAPAGDPMLPAIRKELERLTAGGAR